MKRLMRLFSVVVLIALLAVPSLTAFAQDGANPLCQGLTPDDCALLTSSDAAMAGVTSFSTPDWNIGLRLSLPDETGTVQTIEFSAMGSTGGFDMSPGAAVIVYLVIDEGTITAEGQTQTGSAEVILTPTMGYVKYNDEWYGGEIEEEDLDLSQLGELGGAASLSALGDLGIDLTGVLTTTRGDAEMMGQAMAAFTTDVNVGQMIVAVLGSPMLGSLLGDELGGEAMSPEDLQMIGMFLTPMLAGTTLSAERWIGLDDNYIHQLAVDLVLALDLSMLAPEIGKIDGEIHFASGVANFNQPLNPEIPASFRPIEELEDELNATMGQLEGAISGLGM